jgi:alpha-maltose-1-phosphate synthase
MKILAAIIVPPHLSASGGANAGISLSQAVADYCSVDIAILSLKEATSYIGNARFIEKKCSNLLSFTQGFLPNKFRTLLYQSDIPSLIENGCYDLVHIHNPIPALEMKRVAIACVKKGVPYVISTHGFVEITSGGQAYSLNNFHEKLAWKLFIDKPLSYVIEHATKVFALSPLEYPTLNSMGIKNNKICVVTNGVNPAFYSRNSESEIQTISQKFGLPNLGEKKSPIAIFLGNHTQNKGINCLLDAFKQVEKSFNLIICGKKRSEIDYDVFSKQCSENKKIIFTDRLSNEEIACLFQYADIFVYPTLSDTLPLVILEAMASGLPVIATNVGGIPYQIDESCGVLVEAGNPLAVKEAFEYMTEDMHKLREMSNAVVQVVKAKFDWNKSAQKAFIIYQDILLEKQNIEGISQK